MRRSSWGFWGSNQPTKRSSMQVQYEHCLVRGTPAIVLHVVCSMHTSRANSNSSTLTSSQQLDSYSVQTTLGSGCKEVCFQLHVRTVMYSLNQRFSVAKRSFSGQVLCLRRIGQYAEEQNHRRPKGRRCLHFGPDHQEGSLSPRRKT